MTTQIKNGNQGAIICTNCRENFDDITVLGGKSHATEAAAMRWAKKQIGPVICAGGQCPSE